MKTSIVKTLFILGLLVLTYASCKKKENAPEELPEPVSAPKVDYRDTYTGRYAATFTTLGSPPIVQTKTVTLRYATQSEIPKFEDYMPVGIFVTLDSIPFDYDLCFPIDTAGKSKNSGIPAQFGSGKFTISWNSDFSMNQKQIIGAGTKLP